MCLLAKTKKRSAWVACREPLLREGEKQAVVSYDRRLREHVVSEGVLLSKTGQWKSDSVFGHAACCLDSTSLVSDIVVHEIYE